MSGYNMATGMYGLFPNWYNNQVALNDLTKLDMYPMLGYMTDPLMSMNAGIFQACPGFNMPYMPTYPGGYNYENYYKNYSEYQDFMIDRRVNYEQKMRNANLKLHAPEEGIAKQAAILHEKIMQNEQQQIQQAYKAFKESVRAMYGGGDDTQIANRASSLYKQVTGVSLTDDIRQHGRDSFTQGFLQTTTFGIADSKTAEENIAELTGQPVGRSERAKKIAGNIAGGAVFGGAAAISAKYLLKAFCAGAKNKTFWAAIIGGIAGVGAALATAKS